MNGFWTDDFENTPDAVLYKAVGKFESKVLVWCAISETDVSTPNGPQIITLNKLSLPCEKVKFHMKFHFFS
jgi:hypothetical protein